MLTTINTGRGRRRWTAALCLAAALAGCMPPGPRALLDGERLLQQGRPTDAVRRLRDAVEFLPANAQAWNHLGLALHGSRQPAEAAAAYEHALRLDRNLAAAHFNLGCLRLEQGDAAGAADSLRTFVLLQPRSHEGWVKLGQAQLRLRQWEAADRSFTSALRLQAGDPEALNGLGVSYQQRRRPREAWQCFTNVLSRDPRHAPAWLNLAVVAQQAGARPQAAQAYRRYAALRPDAAKALGLEALVRELEPPPAPVIPPAPRLAPAAPTNQPPAPAASAPSPTPVAPGATRETPVPSPANARPAVAGAPTSAPPAVVNSPAQTRAPPPRAGTTERVPTPAAVESPAAESVSPTASVAAADRTEVVAPTNPAPAAPPPSAPATEVVASPSPERPVTPAVGSPGLVVIAPPAAAASVTSTVAAAAVPAAAPPAVSPGTLASSNLAPSRVEAAIPPPAPPIAEVTLPADSRLATDVKDEPWTGPLPSAEVPAAKEPAPLIRPVSARKAPTEAEKRGFWGRANPLNWFESEPEKEPSSAAPPASVAEREGAAGKDSSAEESSRWRWANPGSWFRPGRGEAATPTVTKPAAPAAANPVATATGSGTTPAGVPRATGATSPPVVVAAVTPPPSTPSVSGSGSPDAGSASSARRATRRYLYRNPAPPEPGDAAAARVLVAEGVQEHRRNRLDAAVARYEEALRADPACFDARHSLASARLQQGDLPRALEEGEEALALRPDAAPARLNFALALDRAGYPADAAVEAEKVVNSKPDDVSAHLLLGNLYSQKLDRPDRAREHYLRVIELEPEHSQSIAIRRWLAGR